MRPVESQVGPGDLSGMIQMASCQTGIPGDGGDSLYRSSSSLRRRRDASPVRGTVVCFRLQEVLLSIHFQQLYLL